MTTTSEHWPALPLESWQDTYATLHLWCQIVGKIRMVQMPWINHSWHVPFYVTARGLSTTLIPYGHRGFEIDFDFFDHRLRIAGSDGERRSFALQPMSVAAFYRKLMRALGELDIEVPIWPMPVELPDPIQPFPENETQAAYDAEAVGRYWRALPPHGRIGIFYGVAHMPDLEERLLNEVGLTYKTTTWVDAWQLGGD